MPLSSAELRTGGWKATSVPESLSSITISSCESRSFSTFYLEFRGFLKRVGTSDNIISVPKYKELRIKE
jgi:hypothetical protein